MKSCVIKIRNLPEMKGTLHQIRVKPVAALSLIIVLGAVLIVRYPSFISAALGMIMMACFALSVMPDRTLMTFSDEFLVLYNQNDRSSCMLIYWDEVVNWQYEWHPVTDLFIVNLTDGSSEAVEMYSKRKIVRCMNQYLPGREIRSSRIKQTV